MIDQADISGDPLPEPVHNVQQAQAEARREARQNQPAPTPSPEGGAPQPPKSGGEQGTGGRPKGKDGNPIGDFFSRVGDTLSPLKGLPGALEHGVDQAQQTGPLRSWEKNPFLPARLGAEAFDNKWSEAAFGAQVAKSLGLFLNPDMISESAKNVWERSDAVGQAYRTLWKAGTAATPGFGALAKTGLLGQGDEQQMATVTGQGLSFTANPSNIVMPEGHGAQLVAMLGLPLAQGLMSSGDGMEFFRQLSHMDLHDPQTYMNLLWAGSTALMLRGHVPGLQSAAMRKLMPEWADLEKEFAATRDAHQQAMRDSIGRAPSLTEDWRQKLLRNQPVPGGARVLVNGITDAQKERAAQLTGKMLPGGEIRLTPSDEAQVHIDRQKAVLKRLGYKSLDDLGLAASMRGITGKQAQTIVDHWKDLGQTYDLVHEAEPDRPLHSPIDSLNRYSSAADQKLLPRAVHMDNLERAYGAAMRQTLFATNDVPRSMFRSMLGLARTKDVVHEMYWGSVHDLLEKQGVKGEDVTKAMEGDREAYDALPTAGKHVVDSSRRLNALYQTLAKDAGYRNDFIGNFFWRRPQRVEALSRYLGGKHGKAPVASEKFNHRATKIEMGEDGKLVSKPAYDTIADTNKAIQEQRDYYASRLADPAIKADDLEGLLHEMSDQNSDEPFPWETQEGKKQTPLPKSMQTDPEVQAIRNLAMQNPDAARRLATQWVNSRFPLMEQDFFKVAPSAMRRQVGALHTHQAVDMLSKSLTTFRDATGKPRLQPGAVRITDSRQAQELANAGYKPVDMGRRYDGWLFHPDFADSLSKAMQAGSALRQKKGYQALMKLERAAIKSIMFVPMAHGLNVAGRFGTYWLQHPLDTTRWMLAGQDRPFSLPLRRASAALHDATHPDHERDALAYRMEAWLSGMVTPDKSSNWGYEFSKTHAGAIGDGDFIDSAATQDQSGLPQDVRRSPGGLATAGGKAVNLYNSGQQKFWSWVNDFGTMVYHLDKERLTRSGFSDEEARLWAMRRANTWMGHVAPEDWNPVVHDILRGLMFAPNWWRTLGEMYAPKYGRMGIQWTPQMIRHVVGEEMKTAAASLAFQKLTGNALNVLTSGHTQQQNQPGAQDKIELTEPWTDHLPWVSGMLPGSTMVPRTDPKTGARRTLENPLSRQTLDLERVLGYESGRPGGPSNQAGPLQVSAPSDWQAVMGGSALTAAGRLAPALEAGLESLTGLDVYGSIRDGTPRHLDPGAQGPTPYAALLGMLQMLPGGSEAAYQIQQANRDYAKGKSWGTVTSDTIQKMLGTEPSQILSGWLTGVNPAYSYANKSGGQPPSDAAYQNASALKQDQQKWLTDSSTQVMTGGALENGQPATLQNWLREYHDREIAYVNQMQAYYKNDPSYLNGQDGLVNRWEQLYDQARFDPSDPLSEVDYGKLDKLQAQFKQGLSSDQQQLLQQGLAQNRQQNPILRLYHDTLTAYSDVQQLWAQKQGVSSSQLRQEISEYGQLYGQKQEAEKYLHSHRDLAAWETWKRQVFYKSNLGRLYGLWYGSSQVLGNVHDLPAFQQQLVQQEEQSLFPQEQQLEAMAGR